MSAVTIYSKIEIIAIGQFVVQLDPSETNLGQDNVYYLTSTNFYFEQQILVESQKTRIKRDGVNLCHAGKWLQIPLGKDL